MTIHGRQTDPTGGQDPQNMSMSKQSDRTARWRGRQSSANHCIRTLAYVFNGFAADQWASPNAPFRAMKLPHLLRRFPFGLAIIPLLKIVVDDGNIPKARDLARLASPLTWTDKYGRKLLVRHGRP